MNTGKTVLVTLLLAGQVIGRMASGQDDGEQTASLSLVATTDSQNTRGRHYVSNTYLDEECKKPKKKLARLFKKKFAKDEQVFDSVEIPVGQPMLLQVNYSEKRLNQDRLCSYIVGFSPAPGRAYKAIYEVTGQTSRCSLKIVDVTDGAEADVETTKPQFLCERAGKKGGKNGIAHHIIDQY